MKVKDEPQAAWTAERLVDNSQLNEQSRGYRVVCNLFAILGGCLIQENILTLRLPYATNVPYNDNHRPIKCGKSACMQFSIRMSVYRKVCR